jgi:hypothetical protein
VYFPRSWIVCLTRGKKGVNLGGGSSEDYWTASFCRDNDDDSVSICLTRKKEEIRDAMELFDILAETEVNLAKSLLIQLSGRINMPLQICLMVRRR